MSEFDSFAASDSGTYDFSSDPSGAVGGSAAGSMAQLQMMVQQEQQKALVQQAISSITEIAWDKCMGGRPDSTLSSRESTCLENVAKSYLDTR